MGWSVVWFTVVSGMEWWVDCVCLWEMRVLNIGQFDVQFLPLILLFLYALLGLLNFMSSMDSAVSH
jgi:hypothetical protein